MLILSRDVRDKLASKTPPVSECEIRECFANREGNVLIDSRAKNMTNPLTRWFISETDHGRVLKICFIPMPNKDIVIKTAYEPNATEVGIYRNKGM